MLHCKLSTKLGLKYAAVACSRSSNLNINYFDVHLTVHRDKFLIKKKTRGTDFSNLFLE